MKRKENTKKSEVRSPKTVARSQKPVAISHPERSRRMKIDGQDQGSNIKDLEFSSHPPVDGLNTGYRWWLN